MEVGLFRVRCAQRAVAAGPSASDCFVTVAFGLKLPNLLACLGRAQLLSAAALMLFGRYFLSFMTLRWAKQGRSAFALDRPSGEQAEDALRRTSPSGGRAHTQSSPLSMTGAASHDARTFHGHPVIPSVDRHDGADAGKRCDEIIIALPWSQHGRSRS